MGGLPCACWAALTEITERAAARLYWRWRRGIGPGAARSAFNDQFPWLVELAPAYRRHTVFTQPCPFGDESPAPQTGTAAAVDTAPTVGA